MRQLDSYDAIHVHGSMHVTLTSGDEVDIKIEAEENLMEYIETTNKKGKLHIKTKDNTNVRTSLGKEITLYVPVAEVAKLTLSGSGDINAKNLKVNNCQASVTGSGDIAVYALSHLKSTIVGSGDVLVNKSVKTTEKKVVGSGEATKY